MRYLALATATACLLAMPTLAWLTPYIYFEPSAPSEYVSHYESRVRALSGDCLCDCRRSSPDATAIVELGTLPHGPFFIDVRAHGIKDIEPSEWSPAHCELIPGNCTADLDRSGGVGPGDYNMLASRWGEVGYGAEMFEKLSREWGQLTVWDERLGLRRLTE